MGVVTSLLATAIVSSVTAESLSAWFANFTSWDVIIPGWQALGVLMLAFFFGVGVTLMSRKLPGRLLRWTRTKELRHAILDVVYLTREKGNSWPHDGTFNEYLGYLAPEDRIAKVRDQLIEEGLLKVVSPGGAGKAYELTGAGGALLKQERIRRRNLPKYYEVLG